MGDAFNVLMLLVSIITLSDVDVRSLCRQLIEDWTQGAAKVERSITQTAFLRCTTQILSRRTSNFGQFSSWLKNISPTIIFWGKNIWIFGTYLMIEKYFTNVDILRTCNREHTIPPACAFSLHTYGRRLKKFTRCAAAAAWNAVDQA